MPLSIYSSPAGLGPGVSGLDIWTALLNLDTNGDKKSTMNRVIVKTINNMIVKDSSTSICYVTKEHLGHHATD